MKYSLVMMVRYNMIDKLLLRDNRTVSVKLNKMYILNNN